MAALGTACCALVAAAQEDDELAVPRPKASKPARPKAKKPPPAATAPGAAGSTAPAPSAPAAPSVETHAIEARDLKTPVVEEPAPPPPALPPPPPGERPFALGAHAGVVAPLSTLTAGVYAGARLSFWPASSGLLELALSAGYEHHTGLGARLFPGPGGGLDGAAFENQALLPVELSLAVAPVRDELNRLAITAGYGLVGVWSSAHALGSTRSESGLGHQLSIGLSYSRRLGPLRLFVAADWGVRRTAVGARTAVLELPWYQLVQATAGITFSL